MENCLWESSVPGSGQRVDRKWLPLSGRTTPTLCPSDRPIWLAWQHCHRCDKEQNCSPFASGMFFHETLCERHINYISYLCVLDRASSWYLNKGRPTWWHLLYYVNLLLKMFRMLIHPSSGACHYLVRYCVGCIVLTWGVLVLCSGIGCWWCGIRVQAEPLV